MPVNSSLNHKVNNLANKPERLKEVFDRQETYTLKVAFYDQHFGIIPFDFPPFDSGISWLHSESELLKLTAIVTQERNRSVELFEQRFHLNGKDVVFSIKPVSETQKWFLNQYIFQKFLSRKTLQNENNDLSGTDQEIIDHLKNSIHKSESLLVRINELLQDTGESMMRIRFVSIFYKGYADYHSGNEKVFKIKRKFIELFLMSQGYLFAEYMQTLKDQLAALSNEKRVVFQEELKKKIIMLYELGVIGFLEKKVRKEKRNNSEKRLAEWICKITDTDPSCLNLVHKYLTDIQSFYL